MKSKKKAKLNIEANQIINDYVKIAQNSSNMIAFISSNLQNTPFREIVEPPIFSHTNFGKINYVGDKKIYLDMWLYNHGVNDIIKGINLSLARANHFKDLIELHGKTMTVKEYQRFEKKSNEKYLRKDLPSLINLTKSLTNKPLLYTDEIISINNLRKCLEHRIGKVTEIDAKTEVNNQMVLLLKWVNLEISILRNGEKIILDKPGILLNETEHVTTTIINKSKNFEIGEYIRIDLEHLNQLLFIGYLFVKHIADNYSFNQ